MVRHFRLSYVKLCILSTLGLLAIALNAFQFKQQDGKVYKFGKEDGPDWHKQPDMLAFKIPSGNDMPDIKSRDDIDRIETESTADRKLIQVSLKDKSRDKKKQIAKKILSNSQKMIRLPVLTTAPEKAANQEKWVIADNRLLIQLKKKKNHKQVLQRLANNYNLQIERLGDIAHLMRIQDLDQNGRGIFQTADQLQQTEHVKLAYPNRLEMFKAHGGDAKLDKAWHIANHGGGIWCNGKTGEKGADISLQPVWDQGFMGQGVKVGVIDFFGFDYDHPDMQGRIAAGYNCIDNSSYNASNFFFTDKSNAHAMTVSGIIAANKNNDKGSAGVAPEATIVPFLIDNSEASIILALEKAISSQFNVDVINMSFGAPNATSMLQDAITKAVDSGRSGKGTVLVASHGNENKNDQNEAQYPSAYSEVISVGATTPEDKRKKPGDGWDVTGEWGSNYGEMLDVVAPGVCIISTDLTGSKGYYEDGDFVGLSRTSSSAPIVTGTVASLLEKNPDLSWQGVREKIRNGADEVGDYSYNKQGGKSLETGYGRINAAATLGVPVGIAESSNAESDLSFAIKSPFNRDLTVFVKGRMDDAITMTLYNMAGQQQLQRNIKDESRQQTFNVDKLAKGIYITSFRNQKGKVLETRKLIKTR